MLRKKRKCFKSLEKRKLPSVFVKAFKNESAQLKEILNYIKVKLKASASPKNLVFVAITIDMYLNVFNDAIVLNPGALKSPALNSSEESRKYFVHFVFLTQYLRTVSYLQN